MLACAAIFLALKVVEAPRQGKVRALPQRWLRHQLLLRACVSACLGSFSRVYKPHARFAALCKGVS